MDKYLKEKGINIHMIKLVLLRHGQSTWNKQNRFTGWTDVPLSPKGKKEARESGKILKKAGFVFDVVHESVLRRSIQTTDEVLKVLEQKPKRIRHWRLNERFYGSLQGHYKHKMARKYGEKQVLLWRRSLNVRPPAVNKKDKRWPGNYKTYKDVPRKQLPFTENLADTMNRVLPYWKKEIVPELKHGNSVLISAHGNSLRALVAYFDKIPKKDVPRLNIPTGVPLVYELDKNLKPSRHYYLGDKNKIKKSISKVEKQGKV